ETVADIELGHPLDERCRFDAERPAEPQDGAQAHVPLAALDGPDVGPVQAHEVGQVFLTELRLLSASTHPGAELDGGRVELPATACHGWDGVGFGPLPQQTIVRVKPSTRKDDASRSHVRSRRKDIGTGYVTPRARPGPSV